MEGTPRRYLIAYAGAFLIGVVMTYVYALMLARTGHLVYVIVVVPLFAYVFSDLLIWLRRGVRTVEMDSTGFSVRLVRDQQPTHIDANQVTGVYVSRFLDRTTVNILLRGATVRRFLGIRRYTGPRIRLTNEPFDNAQFRDFLRRVTKLRHPAPAPE